MKKLKKFFIKFYSGVSLGLISSGLTVLVLDKTNFYTGLVLAIIGAIIYGFSEGLK